MIDMEKKQDKVETQDEQTRQRIKVDDEAIVVGESSKKYSSVPKEYYLTDDGYAIPEEQAEEMMFEQEDFDCE
jgi:hypothetical protein